MPTRKQRRRRDKDRRHEYEYVYVDEQGHEVEVEQEPEPQRKTREERASRNGKAPAPAKGQAQRRRPLRPVQPPSLKRSATRAALFTVLLFALISFVGKKQPPMYSRVALALVYGAIAVPFFFWMDRLAYRRYQRATGAEPTPAPRRPKRR